MNRLKKFLIVFLSFLPFTAGAIAPLVVGGIAGIGVIAGFSIYRTAAPVNMADAMNFFSSCWSCQMFADVMTVMSDILPPVYHSLGAVIIPFSAGLLAIWFALNLGTSYINAKSVEVGSLTNDFGNRVLKFCVITVLLAAPLPRLLTDIAIEPIFNVGLSLNRAISGDDEFAKCMVATAIADPVAVSSAAATRGAYSPHLRHNLACELANVHQMTGLGMTVGWTMMNMAFNEHYMHKILWAIPFFPNVPIFFGGLMITVLFFLALLPVPIFFLEIFIKLSMDLIMLPLMLMSWVFQGWKIIPDGKKNIQTIINDVVQGTLGIALTGVFVVLAVMFLNAVFGNWDGATALAAAMAQNDSKILMDGLMMHNDSLITIIMMGIFIAMFMTMIPALIKTLFSVSMSDDFYKTFKNNMNTLWGGLKKVYAVIKK